MHLLVKYLAMIPCSVIAHLFLFCKWIWGHSRSLEMTPLSRACVSPCYHSIVNCGSISYRFRDIQRQIILILNSRLVYSRSLKVAPSIDHIRHTTSLSLPITRAVVYCFRVIWRWMIRDLGLDVTQGYWKWNHSHMANVTVSLAVSTQYTNVTASQTDIKTSAIAATNVGSSVVLYVGYVCLSVSPSAKMARCPSSYIDVTSMHGAAETRYYESIMHQLHGAMQYRPAPWATLTKFCVAGGFLNLPFS